MSSQIQNQMNCYWSERADSYGGQVRRQLNDDHRENWKQLILRQMPAGKTLNILDIGTGPGFFAILMAEEGHHVIAVDMNENMLREARDNAQKCGVSVDFRQTGPSLPFHDESFDLVISRDVTWTLPNPEETMLHWFSKVGPGGFLLYFDANWYEYLQSEDTFQDYQEYRRYVEANRGFTYQKAGMLEKVALELPMTYRKRPQWDQAFWVKQGVKKIVCEERLNPQIYNPIEQIQYDRQQEFLVAVQKG